jgi:cellobiose epimerase
MQDAAVYRALADEIEVSLKRHILDCWFPRAVDPAGGFHQNFDEVWTLRPGGQKSVVYQSRLTWTAAEAFRRDSKNTVWRERALHGLTFLNDSLWDCENGGFHWSVGRDGKPTQPEKHVYGIAFAMFAAATVFEVLREPRALELAKKTFEWLEAHPHDSVNQGWYEALTPVGSPVGRKEGRDAIGTAYGLKSMNTHIHLLEALTVLYGVWKTPPVKKQLAEAFHVIRDRVVQSDGFQQMFFQPDWAPAGDHISFGHDVETAFLLLEAEEALGESDETTSAKARKLVDFALAHGWDTPHGGFFDSAELATRKVTVREKIWWVEAEGLNALLLMHFRYDKGASKTYWDAFSRQWAFIRDHQIDSTRNGWYPTVAEDGARLPGRSKSDAWTDPYHQARACWRVVEALRRHAR